MNRVAIITGANGQDGSYLCELLLEKGYTIYACVRRSSQDNLLLIRDIVHRLNIRYIDMADGISLSNVFSEVNLILHKYERCEVYNLAAQSHVHVSFFVPDYTSQCDGLGFLRILECVRQSPHPDKYRVYQASTSELYGDTTGSTMQTETTPFRPKSPYATAKLYAYWIARNYRESYGIFISNGILFNHESPRRGIEFVTRKITKGLCNFHAGRTNTPLRIGNLDSKRDWGHAQDYVVAMWLILQANSCDDWVVATGKSHTVRDVIEISMKKLGVDFTWVKDGDLYERAVDTTGRVWVEQSSEFMRPNDVTYLCGDSTKIRTELGWTPNVSFEDMIYQMISTDT
jgi:GDPmannose 4,6-dehydratase